MSDSAIKKRLKNARARITATLSLAGYEVYPFEDGPFHLCADSPDSSKRIRIEFGEASESVDNLKHVSRAPVPPNCHREIWRVSEDGKKFHIIRIENQGKK